MQTERTCNSIKTGLGPLMMMLIMICGIFLAGTATARAQGLLYVLRYVSGSENQIYGFQVNETTGALSALAGFPLGTGGSSDNVLVSEQLAIDAINGRLYVINKVSNTVSAYAINSTTGALTALPFSPINLGAGDWFTLAVHPSGSPLVVGDGGGRILSYQITATTATAAAGSPYVAIAPNSTAFSRDGNFVYTGGNALTSFSGFRVNAATGALTALAGTPFDTGASFPGTYATDSAGRLFLTNYNTGQMRAFSTAAGIPSAVSGNPFTSGLTQTVYSVLHPNGFYLVADRSGNRVGVYQISGSGAATTLTAIAGSPFASGGTLTDVLALNQSGAFLFAANGSSRNLTTFSVNATTGVLTALGTQPADTLGTSGRLTGMGYFQANVQVNCASNPVVTTNADSGAGSLRQAILDACSGGTITFNLAANSTIKLTSGELVIDKNLNIQGPGAQLLTISGNNQSRVFHIVEDLLNVTLSGLTVTDGYYKTPDVVMSGSFVGAERAYGGGIYSQSSGTVNVTNCVLTNNRAQGGNATGINSQNVTAGIGLGGGIAQRGSGTLNINGCRFTDNHAFTGTASGGSFNASFPSEGGAVFSQAEFNLNQCIFTGNSAARGGAISNRGSMTLAASTVSANEAFLDWGGGIYDSGDSSTIINTTLSGNQAGGEGAGIWSRSVSRLITNCTITDNHSSQDSFGGGGIFGNVNPPLQLKNTIIAGNTASRNPDLKDFVTSLGNNLIGDGTGATGPMNGINGDQVGTAAAPLDPKLGPLANNGGTTQTHRLLPGSSAINAGMSNGAPTTDQRGVARPQNSAVDIGAVEAAFTLAATSGTPQTTTLGAPFAAPLLATLTENGLPFANVPLLFAAPVNGASATFPNGAMVNTNSQGQAGVNAVANFVLGSYVVQATAPGLAPATFNLTNICPTITFQPVSLPAATINTAYPTTLSATPSGAYSFVVTSGLLPAGLTLNSNGTFGGAPTQSGTFNFRVTATGFGTCTNFQDYSLVVGCPGITLDATPLPSGIIGTAYNQTRTASPAGSYSYAVSSGALPVGLTLNASTGAITGTPITAGTFNFTITATAGSCSGQQSYSITIGCTTITLASPANGAAGTNYAGSVAASPSGSYSYSIVQGSLPSGLTLNSTTGAVTGVPSITGTYTFTIKAQTINGCSGQQSYTLVIACPTITLPALAVPTLNSPYNQAVAASPSGGNYSFAVTAGALPTGLSLNPATGVISGTPIVAGAYNFTITATGFGNCTGNRAYTGTIAGSSCPTITLVDLPSGQPGQLYSNSVTASPAGSYSYVVTTGSLPPGVTLFGSFGLIYGYPTTAGTFNFTITATDSNNCTGTKSYSLVIGGASVRSLVFGDFDGDGKADLSVWRSASGEWLTINSSDARLKSEVWGTSAAPYFDVMTPGDYDGDGKMDLAVFRRATGEWFIKSSRDGAVTTKLWGLGTDIPVPGDYDGDGKTDIAVWRGTDTNWYIIRSSDGQVQTTSWGTSKAPYNDVPVAADFDGDGKTDIAVFRRANGHWYIKLSSDGSVIDKAWGLGTDVPVAADYDGDGKADIAVWRGAEGNWYVVRSSDGVVQTTLCGDSSRGDKPAPGDYDGNGKADVAVWRESEGNWYIIGSRSNSVLTKAHGRSGDVPVTSKP
ncbi:MAG TPA: putative Ig domain-containing protein [Blastocatellia bacterium]|nr:putative Ig domain-containing protein [Blastocatellia bacterium]HNG31592.1 putative Ig domain-containing protein [Blastocatellia bacterium]